MLVIFSQPDVDITTKPGAKRCTLGANWTQYELAVTDYCYEDENCLVLADLCIDRSKEARVMLALQKLAHATSEQFADICATEFPSGYLVVVADRKAGTLHILRDHCGIKTAYWALDHHLVCVGTVVHDVASICGVASFDTEAIHQLLYLRYFYDGFSYYSGVVQVRMGEYLMASKPDEVATVAVRGLELPSEENGDSEDDSVRKLRYEIDRVHKELCAEYNVVLLSGGVDSCVMLAALPENAEVRARSFRLKDTPEDETVYASDMASHLVKQLTIVEVDPNDENILAQFDRRLLTMNTPYDGGWIFGALEGDLNKTFYAGQDTRLHTPALGALDKIAFATLLLHRLGLQWLTVAPSRCICRLLDWGKAPQSRRRWLRGLYRLAAAGDLSRYIQRYYVHLSKDSIRSWHIDTNWFERVASRVNIDLRNVRTMRELYNRIVTLNWRLQYTDNMEDLQALARFNGTYIVFPFYDYRLACFSATIPYGQAARLGVGQKGYSSGRTMINKWLLRRAYRDRLSSRVFYRDKAVSKSVYLLFNGVLGRKIRALLEADLNSEKSFLREFRLERTVTRYLEGGQWKAQDEQYLWLVYYLGLLCFYNERVLQRSGRHEVEHRECVA